MDFNLCIQNEWWDLASEEDLFGKGEVVNRIKPTDKLDMFDILVLLGVFSSKSQARKNWKQTGQAIPAGWTDIFAGKQRQRISIWNPIPFNNDDVAFSHDC